MKKKHRKTLDAIFKQPIQSNIKWEDVISLLIALEGEVDTRRSGSRVCVYLNGKVTVFHKPHPSKEMDKGAIKNLREFL